MKLKLKWSTESKKQRQISLLNLLIARHTGDVPDFINLVKVGHQGVFASTDLKYSYAIFGRDSIEVAEDLLQSHQKLVHDIILTIASLQGVKYDNSSEEEPGKIHHEFRSEVFEAHEVPPQSLETVHKMQRLWGADSKDSAIYYGSYDATPLYIRLLGRYVAAFGDSILAQRYTDQKGQPSTIAQSLEAATKWLVNKIEDSPWQLLEFRRLNPKGIANQAWKDSETAYLHIDGRRANSDKGIAAVELQGYAYDALFSAARLGAKSKTEQSRYQHLAKRIQETVLDKFWLPEYNFFAQGLDRDSRGAPRQIKSLTSNPAALLESQLLHDLPEARLQKHLQAIVSLICGPEFITAAGIRSRALRHKDLPGFVDYHGSYTVWPKETYDIAKGLHNFGFDELAKQLENRLLASIELAGEFFEFFYVDEQGDVAYNMEQIQRFITSKSSLGRAPIPQKGQAWVISAALSIENRRLNTPVTDSYEPDEFEKSLLSKIPEVKPIVNLRKLLSKSKLLDSY